jgi:cytochrome P450
MTAHSTRVPDHVPAELVLDRDFSEYLADLDDPYLAGARLQDGPAIRWVTNASHGMPAWVFTRHALIEQGFSDTERFSSARGALVGSVMDPNLPLLPVEADPPAHLHFRQILHPFLTPSAVRDRAPAVQALSDELIDAFIDRGTCDFMHEFASVLPNAIVLSLLGMPQDMLRQFLAWEDIVIHGEDPAERLKAGKAILDYIIGFIAEQQRGTPTGLMRGILAGQVEGRPLTEQELLGIVYLLFVAGLDTVFNSLSWMMQHVARDQAWQARLRANPGDIPAAVQEFTRAFGVSAPSRTVARDMVFHGVTMKRGEDVILPTYLAGRDPRAFEHPHVIDIDRKPRHVTFGAGRHVCLGIHLAKREMAIVLETFLTRMRSIRPASDAPMPCNTRSTIGLERLDLAFERA